MTRESITTTRGKRSRQGSGWTSFARYSGRIRLKTGNGRSSPTPPHVSGLHPTTRGRCSIRRSGRWPGRSSSKLFWPLYVPFLLIVLFAFVYAWRHDNLMVALMWTAYCDLGSRDRLRRDLVRHAASTPISRANGSGRGSPAIDQARRRSARNGEFRRPESSGFRIAPEARAAPAPDVATGVHRRGHRPIRLRARLPRQERRHPFRALDAASEAPTSCSSCRTTTTRGNRTSPISSPTRRPASRRIWSNCVGFPRTRALFGGGAADRDRLVRWARRQQHPTYFWYSAYRDLTAARIRINAAIRQAFATAESDQDCADWLALFGSAPRPADSLQLQEIPTLAFGGLSSLRYSACVVITLSNKIDDCKAFLHGRLEHACYGEADPGRNVALGRWNIQELVSKRWAFPRIRGDVPAGVQARNVDAASRT